MILRGSAPAACLCLAAMLHSNAARAGTWGVDPVLGLVGDHASDPALLTLPHTAESNAALLIDAPATYNGNAFELFIVPSFRLGDSRGYSSLASDYEHLDIKSEFDTERGMFTAAAGVARDSSLYHDYLTDGSTGVRRDTVTADLNWKRLLTERTDVDVDMDSQRVHYAEGTGIHTLVDYKYTSITPDFSWKTSEQNKLTLVAGVGRYDSLDGTTMSRSANLQAGFMRQFSEIWSVTATAGYSRALNRLDGVEPELVFTANGLGVVDVPFRVESSQNGAVYMVNVSRQGTRLVLNAIASRQLTPTGFAYLSRQELIEAKASYALSARWSLAADARYSKAQNPQLQTVVTDITIRNLALTLGWRWTEQLTLSMSGSRVAEQIRSPNYNVASNELTITLSRQFDHIKFQ